MDKIMVATGQTNKTTKASTSPQRKTINERIEI